MTRRQASAFASGEILDGVCGTDFVAESNIVDRHIRSLRIKLQNDYKRPRFIETVPGRGYRFTSSFSNEGWVTDEPEGRAATSSKRPRRGRRPGVRQSVRKRPAKT